MKIYKDMQKGFFDLYNNEYLAQKEYRVYTNEKDVYIVVDSIEDYGNGVKGYGSLYNTIVNGNVYQFVILSLSGEELSEEDIQAMEDILDNIHYSEYILGEIKLIICIIFASILVIYFVNILKRI